MTRILAPLVSLVGVGCLVSACEFAPSDDSLRKNFVEHRAEFDALVAMIHHDSSLGAVEEGWTLPEDVASIGLKVERIEDYRRRLASVGCSGFMQNSRSGAIYFTAWSRGFIWAGAAKDFVYSPAAPPYGQHVESLDAYRPTYGGGGAIELYRSLDNGWYLKLTKN